MILRELPVGCSHKATYRQVKTGRAVLPFIVAVRREVHNSVRTARMLQDMAEGPVNVGVSPPTLLVRVPAGIAEAGQYNTVFDSGDGGFVPAEPGDRSDGARNEEKPVREAPRHRHEVPREDCGNGQAGEVVVAERRMTGMTGDEHFILDISGKVLFAIHEIPRL